MTKLGRNAQTDWVNVSSTQMADADFPIYVHDQRPGDLVVFPPMCGHQVWNVARSVTKVVWNILHFTSAQMFQTEIHPVYQRRCHIDTARVPLVLFNILHEIHEKSGSFRPKEATTVMNLFQQLVIEEAIEPEASPPVRSVDIHGSVIQCNFCGCTIWNRHLRCEICGDFDLCMGCFVHGRSCKHPSALQLVEIHDFTKFKTFLEKIMGNSRVPYRHSEPPE